MAIQRYVCRSSSDGRYWLVVDRHTQRTLHDFDDEKTAIIVTSVANLVYETARGEMIARKGLTEDEVAEHVGSKILR